MTKQCKCEHWQDCATCAPQRFDADGKRKAMTDKRARWCKKFFEICNAVGSQQGYECVIGGIQRVVNNGAAIDVSSEAARKCIQAMSGRVTAAKMSG